MLLFFVLIVLSDRYEKYSFLCRLLKTTDISYFWCQPFYATDIKKKLNGDKLDSVFYVNIARFCISNYLSQL
jgi:hypothetical protein